MPEVGQVFVYGTSGVCRVDEITVKECGFEKREYYVLSPVFDSRSTIYVPVDCEKLSSNIHELHTKEQVYAIIDSVSCGGLDWVQNDKERAEQFRSILESGEDEKIIKLINLLHSRKKELSMSGKKLRSSDEMTMQRAEKLLYGEFAWVLGIEPSAVAELIRNRTEK